MPTGIIPSNDRPRLVVPNGDDDERWRYRPGCPAPTRTSRSRQGPPRRRRGRALPLLKRNTIEEVSAGRGVFLLDIRFLLFNENLVGPNQIEANFTSLLCFISLRKTSQSRPMRAY